MAGHISSCWRDLRPCESTYTPMALKHSSSSLLEISTAQRASRLCWGMKARVWSSGWSRPTGETSPWTLGRRRPREVRRFQRGASASADGGAPVAGEARLIADVEPLAEQTHPLDAPGSLQLSQAPVAGFPFVHLQKPPPPPNQAHSG